MDSERDELARAARLERLRQAMYSRAVADKLKPRDRRALRQDRFGVPDDFRTPEEPLGGTVVAPRTIHAARTFALWLLVASVTFFVVAASAFFFYFLVGPGSQSAAPENIDISVRGPLTVISGEPVQLQVVVTNRNQTMLELADLIVRYPQGTRSAADFLTALPEQRISLGEIEPGGQRQGTVSAVLMGREGERSTVTVELEYRTAGTNAIYVSDTEYAFSFQNAPVAIAVEGIKETAAGQKVALTATVSADTSNPLRDVLVELDVPFGFTLESATPDTIRTNTWELGDLRPGDVRTITVRGTLEGQEGDERVFTLRAGTRKEKGSSKIDVTLSETQHHIALERPFIGLDIAINKDGGDDAVTVAAGENVNVVISWQNNLQTPITNAVLVARLSGLALPGTGVKTAEGFYRSADKTVLFDKTTTRGEFAELPAGGKGTVSFSFAMPSAETLSSVKESLLDITLHVAGRRTGESNVPETLQSTARRTVKLASDTRLIGQGFYYQNFFGSTGPLPPKVDQETTYALVLTVANTANTIEEGVVVAQLPPYVRWVGTYSPAQEKLTFNSGDGSLTWHLGTVSPGVGVGDMKPRQVAFMIGFTPSESQVGEQPTLLSGLSLTGKDTFTNRSITVTAAPITTNLVDDPGFSSTEATVVQ